MIEKLLLFAFLNFGHYGTSDYWMLIDIVLYRYYIGVYDDLEFEQCFNINLPCRKRDV